MPVAGTVRNSSLAVMRRATAARDFPLRRLCILLLFAHENAGMQKVEGMANGLSNGLSDGLSI